MKKAKGCGIFLLPKATKIFGNSARLQYIMQVA
jgi:hypothetical protein